jgi:hypothetical protein
LLALALMVAWLVVGQVSVASADETFLVLNTNNDGPGSLHQAILDANSTPGADTIEFDIPGAGVKTIALTTPLPTITEEVFLNGLSQGGTCGGLSPELLIELNGENVGGAVPGLRVSGEDTSILGLVINRFGGNGIELAGEGHHTVYCNYIGTNAAGTEALPNGGNGVWVDNSPGNTIGFTLANPLGNVISGNAESGIRIEGNNAAQNRVGSNRIGVDVTGEVELGNGEEGVSILHAPDNVIGGTDASLLGRNIIAGNGGNGVRIDYPGASGNLVQNNFIGTNIGGDVAMPNFIGVVVIREAADNLIGGADAGDGNVISGNQNAGIALSTGGNTVQGNLIGLTSDGTADLGNNGDGIETLLADNSLIGGTTPAARNVISGNQGDGIHLGTAVDAGVRVQGNFIGVNAVGDSGIPNLGNGITVASPLNAIGGLEAGAGNLISGNLEHGVQFLNTNARENTLQGNLIGLAADGDTPLGNGQSGVMIEGGAENNLVGGTTEMARNIISSNFSTGIHLRNSGDDGNTIQGNYIGTDVSGALDRGNVGGIEVEDSSNVLIGGAEAGAGNLISGNEADGLRLTGIDATNNRVQGNIVGLVANGSTPMGNGGGGVLVLEGANDNLIGGAEPGARNIISANTNLSGVVMMGNGTTANRVQGNYIGTDVAGLQDRGNEWYGVAIGSGATSNTIGGAEAGAGNLISGNDQGGILLSGTALNTVQGNRIGTDASGANSLGNGGAGIRLTSAPRNLIGGTEAGAGNVVASSAEAGIYLTEMESTGNRIQGNHIGTNAEGSAALSNGSHGILIESPTNTVGGTEAGAGNLISGNGEDGVHIAGANATTNQLSGNLIGVNRTGDAPLPNREDGVHIEDTAGALVGGPTDEARNVISGNIAHGLYVSGTPDVQILGNRIGTSRDGTAALGNGEDGLRLEVSNNAVVGGAETGAGNLISANGGQGLYLICQHATLIQGNFIGTDVTGTADLGNGANGVRVFEQLCIGDAALQIGGTAPGAGNLISGNGENGIHFAGFIEKSQIQGNRIGTNLAGTAALANEGHGVYVNNSPNNLIGGTEVGARNLISGNGALGILIEGSDSIGNRVHGNFIGTNEEGTAALANGTNGVTIQNAVRNEIGAPGKGNLISGNDENGVEIAGAGAITNRVQGNRIGTDVSGTSALPNGDDGVEVDDARGNDVGGAVEGAGNLISGNLNRGVLIIGAGATGNRVQGNRIGTAESGITPLANGTEGVRVEAFDSEVGGTEAGAANTVAFNGGQGVQVTGGTGNAILGNAIFGNGQLGIALGADNVTANDEDDPDAGPNTLQNFPVLVSVDNNGGVDTTIEGTLNSTANTTFRVEFFVNESCDPSEHGEGQHFLGAEETVTTGADGNAAFSLTVPPVPPGQAFSATATNPEGNTSEFSACYVTQAPVAADDAYQTDEETVLHVDAPGLLDNDSDAENDSLTAVLVESPAHGTVEVAEDGSFTYTPDADFFGDDSFTYRANDGAADSNVATATIEVTPVNDAPQAIDDAYEVPAEEPLVVGPSGVLVNDSDADGEMLSALLVDEPLHGTLDLNEDGSFIYTPGADFDGEDSFTYRATDGTADSNVATVTLSRQVPTALSLTSFESRGAQRWPAPSIGMAVLVCLAWGIRRRR